MRARYPDREGYVERDGVKTFYEVFGDGTPTILLLPPWSILHSRLWKMQVPYLARHYRVVTFDGRGNGRSDRPAGAPPYVAAEFAADAVGSHGRDRDRAGRGRVAFSGCGRLIAPERRRARTGSSAQVFLCPRHRCRRSPRRGSLHRMLRAEPDSDEGLGQGERLVLAPGLPRLLGVFHSQVFPEPHSTKQIEDAIGWGLDTTAETLVDTRRGAREATDDLQGLIDKVRCPCLVIQGTEDAIVGPEAGPCTPPRRRTRGTRTVAGSGHAPQARDPVQDQPAHPGVRRLARPDAAAQSRPLDARPSRGPAGPSTFPRPSGLGHARRDVAIADELRKLHPDLEIDWLAQHPVTTGARGQRRAHPSGLGHAGERVRPHRGRVRRARPALLPGMAETWTRSFVANFMVFHDVVGEEEPYDLWIGDEAWELDYYLHENPEQKRAAYVWLTDFVGWLPMPDGGEREAVPRGRLQRRDDRAYRPLPADPRPGHLRGGAGRHRARPFGPGLPGHPRVDRGALRLHRRLRHRIRPGGSGRPGGRCVPSSVRADEQVCIVTVGGSGVGAHLLRRVIAAHAEAGAACPAAHDRGRRSRASTPPRCPPRRARGPRVRAGPVPPPRRLRPGRVQGGLTTTMELTANGRPFLYFPLRHHFEQNFHVPTGWTGTAPAGAWTTPPPRPRPSPPPSPRRSAAESTTGPWTDGAAAPAARIAELL